MFRFARNDGDFRNDGILNEIASVALLPRNDAGNSRIPYRDPRVKPEDDIGFEMPRSSRGMTKKVISVDGTRLRNSRFILRNSKFCL